MLRVFPDVDRLSEALACAMAERIAVAVRRRGFCALALSGGRTPRVADGALAWWADAAAHVKPLADEAGS